MKKRDFLTANYEKAASALTWEVLQGNIHIDICEHIAAMDPFIGNHAPTFFTYTFHAHLSAAQLYAYKLFDSHDQAFTVPKFIAMAQMRLGEFKNGSRDEVTKYMDQANGVITGLRPVRDILKKRRDSFIAHISPALVFNREQLVNGPPLTFEQIREVLLEGGRIVNQLLHYWKNEMHQLRDLHSEDVKNAIRLMYKQLHAQADADDEERKRHNYNVPVPRPAPCESS